MAMAPVIEISEEFVSLAEAGFRYGEALLRYLEMPWQFGKAVGGPTGLEESDYTRCPCCGLAWGPPENGWHLDPRWHYDIGRGPCPWLLAAQTLLGMEARA